MCRQSSQRRNICEITNLRTRVRRAAPRVLEQRRGNTAAYIQSGLKRHSAPPTKFCAHPSPTDSSFKLPLYSTNQPQMGSIYFSKVGPRQGPRVAFLLIWAFRIPGPPSIPSKGLKVDWVFILRRRLPACISAIVIFESSSLFKRRLL